MRGKEGSHPVLVGNLPNRTFPSEINTCCKKLKEYYGTASDLRFAHTRMRDISCVRAASLREEYC